jgi:flagellum-specific peptidoglycan hydrolase FlgJ
MSERRSSQEMSRRKFLGVGIKPAAFVVANTVIHAKTGVNPVFEVLVALKHGFLDEKPADVPIAAPLPAPNGSPEVAAKDNNIWRLNPNYAEVINALPFEQHKKEFVLFSIDAANRVINAGYKINPRVMIAQAALESAYGTDTLSSHYNFLGIKAGEGEPSVRRATHEDYGNGQVSIKDDFIAYDNPYQVFFDYAYKMTNWSFYMDAAECSNDDRLYLQGLVHQQDSCQIVRRQGEPGVKSYATARNYVEIGMNVIDFLNLNEVFTTNNPA